MAHVHRIRTRGQDPAPVDTSDPEALRAWVARLRVLLGAVRPLAEDATMRSGERVHSRHYLRRNLLRTVRLVEIHAGALDPGGAPAAAPEPERDP